MRRFLLIIMVLLSTLLCSCSRLLGWGVLLWSIEDPAIPSGTVLPVYIRSNIAQVWVVGLPGRTKIEIPLWQLELKGGKRAARQRAAEFAGYARLYAETLQDGLPIRFEPDNSARRVYRLRMGQIIKILEMVRGNPAISTTGEPLPGDWYRVLTEDGAIGYCFSYRLKLFEHTGGPLGLMAAATEAVQEDPDLDMVLARSWYPDWYGTMVVSRRIDLADLSKRWRFSPSPDTGIAHLYLPTADLTFSYTGIQRLGSRSWQFLGSPGTTGSLRMQLPTDTTLVVQYTESGGFQRSATFISLPRELDDLIAQETERRETLFQNLYALGPDFQSTNYGNLRFAGDGRFIWTGNSILIPHIIPPAALSSGSIGMELFLSPDLEDRYTGAFTLRFDGVSSGAIAVHFIYTPDDQGLRIEYVPPENLDGTTVTRRAPAPTVIYFFTTDQQPEL
ncbi:lipoprotein [Spirochaetia bacterium]|nr:lipoprotein [Spirochaetia bacterium]